MQQQRIVVMLVGWFFLVAVLGTLAPQAIAQKKPAAASPGTATQEKPAAASPGTATQEKPVAVSPGTQVSIEYTLKLDDKNVFDTNVGADPLTFVHGSRQIVPGLEKALEGMKVGESKQVTVQPEEGYGQVHNEAFLELDKEKIPNDARQVGARVQGRTGDGKMVTARVAEVKDGTVVLDFNHPLAGKTLYFVVKVLDIQAQSTQ
jgi:FKBP-type peptidyl-prolyl cis-trans isomerase SlyD